jgi:hypothetical protein
VKQVTLDTVMDLFARYIENTLGLPDRQVRLSYEAVKARPLVPGSKENPLDTEEESEFLLIEEVLPEEIVAELNACTIWEEDLSLYICFNCFTFEWAISFVPSQEIGFEITGSSFQEVLEAVYQNLENRVMFDAGLPQEVDIDEEWRIYNGGISDGS